MKVFNPSGPAKVLANSLGTTVCDPFGSSDANTGAASLDVKKLKPLHGEAAANVTNAIKNPAIATIRSGLLDLNMKTLPPVECFVGTNYNRTNDGPFAAVSPVINNFLKLSFAICTIIPK